MTDKTDKNTAAEVRIYEAPRIVSHSAEGLQKVSLAMNACTGFSRSRDDDGDDKSTTTY
ncbi:hypothetical protein KQI84_05520 [bacterium]|nr:hypothetical protein [bacterium]